MGRSSSPLQRLLKLSLGIGRRYQGQAFALIALCRHLDQNNPTDDSLQMYCSVFYGSLHNTQYFFSLFQLADNALLAANNAGKNETSAANDAFKKIWDLLEEYPPATPDSQKLFNAFKDACSKDESTVERIQKAMEKAFSIVCVFYTLVLKVRAHGLSLAYGCV
jgi:hypothetical protein